MPKVTKLARPNGNLTEYINVSAKVGAMVDCANHHDDVLVVQKLLRMIIRGTDGDKLGVPAPSGSFDATTGFHIFYIQQHVKKARPTTVIDGCVSPAHGVQYSADGVYAILHINAMAQHRDPHGWAQLLDRYR